jgi:hypothetical protein
LQQYDELELVDPATESLQEERAAYPNRRSFLRRETSTSVYAGHSYVFW